ncbi:MAG: AAA domain-containing protein [Acidimicrobiaceae bacterium]|nr:AAA domain-containing protein [Acidimicrobiaceae bacterium]
MAENGEARPNRPNDVHGRLDAVRRAAEGWRKDLFDPSGKNRLRNYRDLKTGTLDLTPGGQAGVSAQALDRLLAGRKVRLSELFSTETSLDAAAPFEDAQRRTAAIHKTALTNLEEKGIDTCFAGIGLATWSVEQRTEPNAPVILVPIRTSRLAAAARDFELSVAGDAHLNPVLAYVLAGEHGLNVEEVEAELADEQQTSLDGYRRLINALTAVWSTVPEFDIALRAVLGNFSYFTMPLVQDLDKHTEFFASNDLVAAIAGSAAARSALVGSRCDPDPNRPNHEPPASEFLVLDADSSQHQAINQVLGGESLVIQGPPGTGKSQTIANLIGALAGQGKRVLFVAEKRAAIEAVTKRINGAGLGDLVMDLHGGISSRREFAAGLATSLANVSRIPAQDYSELHNRLAASRGELLAMSAALHEARAPWNLSVYEIQQRLLRLADHERPPHRMSSNAARHISSESWRALEDHIVEWVELDGHRFAKQHPRWHRSAVTSPTEAQAALDELRRTAHTLLPAVDRKIRSCLEAVGVPLPDKAADRANVLELLGDIRSLLDRCGPEVYSLDHAALETVFARARGSSRLNRLLSRELRHGRKTVEAVLLDEKQKRLSAVEAAGIAELALRHCSLWAELGADGAPRAPADLDGALSAVGEALSALARLAEIRLIDPTSAATLSWAALSDDIAALAAEAHVAQRLPRLRELDVELRSAGVDVVLSSLDDECTPLQAAAVVERAWLDQVLEDIVFAEPRLANFDTGRATRTQAEFAEFDRTHIGVNPMRIRRNVAEAVVAAMNEHPTEADLIRKEAAKKRRHRSIRQMLADAPHVLTSLRPCWTMSPVLVAEMIPAQSGLFDVVIFDEASQIPPAEAISSLARARQAVIAGDSNQLPPTAFFGRDAFEDDSADETDFSASDVESLLDLATVFLRETMLTWHYRSRDDRLIAFSNRHIYGGSLTAFPGTATAPPLAHHVVGFRAIAAANGTNSNPDEARFVAERVLDHAQTSPGETLGVIAFGQKHANAIEAEVRRLQQDLNDPSLDTFLDESRTERFFVKNIERVQGDERDAIILSVGYHKDADGRLLYRFGPLNQEGGERRLNVAVTRARSYVELVSSFGHRDMAPGRSSARGVEMLRQYLEYAASGGQELGPSTHDVPLNPFELSVQRGLRRRGIPATPQFGVSGYRIDFACAHPDQPGLMVLALEADGASYHSSATARDRDRLRQQVLVDKGWRVHRIWSTSWFNNSEAELDEAEAAWREAVADSDAQRRPPQSSDAAPSEPGTTSVPKGRPVRTSAVRTATTPASRGPRPPVPRVGAAGRTGIADYTHAELVSLARWIKADTLVRPEIDLVAELASELGFQRRGKRIVEALTAAAKAAGKTATEGPTPRPAAERQSRRRTVRRSPAADRPRPRPAAPRSQP